MVGASAAGDAIHRAKRLPSLKVGLHLVLVEGRSMLPPEKIPDLVDEYGRFSTDLFKSGVRFFFLPRTRRQLAAEIRAQFAAFRDSGLLLDHVNAHNHMHLHPTVLSLILRIGKDFGLRCVRVPYEPLLPSLRTVGSKRSSRMVSWAALWPWMRLLKFRLRRAGIRSNDFVFGFHDSGHLRAELFQQIIRSLPSGVTEIYCHPATRRCAEIVATMPEYEHEKEFQALIDPEVKAALNAHGVQRLAFSDLPAC
jgi:hopanoid biosynthesis associated protein HpnK